MNRAYSYSGTAADTSATIQKRTNFSQRVHISIFSAVAVAAGAVKIQIEDGQGAFVSYPETEFGGANGWHELFLPTGANFKVVVDNGGVNAIKVDVYI